MRASLFAAALFVAALVLGGCTAAPPAAEVPTATKPSQAAAPPSAEPSQAPLSDYDKALRYTRCMTDAGIPTKDPVVGEMLPVYMSVGSDQARNHFEDAAKFRAAFGRCKALLPATWPVKEDPAQLAKEQPFKECLKRHGIQPFEADSNGMVHYPVDTSYLNSPEYMAAENACRKFYDDPATKVES